VSVHSLVAGSNFTVPITTGGVITTVGAVAVAAGAGGWAAASLEASAFTDIFDDLLFFALFIFFFLISTT